MIKPLEFCIFYIDVDGVLTDNKVYYDQLGNEFMSFNKKDGYAISKIIELGGEVVFITREQSSVDHVKHRASKLGARIVQTTEKAKYILEYTRFENRIIFITDAISDLKDVKVLNKLDIVDIFCPKDSDLPIINECTIINEEGGNGVINRFYIDNIDMYLNRSVKCQQLSSQI